MKHALKLLLLCVFLLAVTKVQAQLRENHKLLWRISGNGLQEDSYLYGTMHLQDQRVFDFSDSVLLKLDACKAFAMEVNPDSIIYHLFKDIAQSGINKNKKVKEMLSKGQYEALASRFKEKTGFELDQVDQSDPENIIRLMEHKEFGEKDNATFLDAYLYDLALRRGKSITSLEEVKDQLDALKFRTAGQAKNRLIALATEENQTDTDKQDQAGEKLLSIYQQGDLDAILEYFTAISSHDSIGEAFVDKLLIQRNFGMHERLVEQIHQASTFIAVGAGHLPGKDGLIDLLRKSGYRVEAVPAVFTNMALKQRQEFKKAVLPWQVFTQEQLGYSVELPRQPFNVVTARFPMPVYFYPELGTGLYYMTVGYNTGIKAKSDAQILSQMMDKMGNNMGTLLRKKDISNREIKGTEAYYILSNGSFIRSNIYIKDGMMIMLATISNVEEALDSDNARRFFKSLKRQQIKSLPWQQFKSEEGAFAINTIGTPNYSTQEVADPEQPDQLYQLHLFSAQNTTSGTFYLFRYNNMPKGMILKKVEEETLGSMAKSIAAATAGTITKGYMTEAAGHPAYYFEFERDEFFAIGKFIARGNRMYLLLAASSEKVADRQEIDEFLNSFAFLPYQEEVMEVYENADFSVLFPSREVHLEEQVQENFYSIPLIHKSNASISTSRLSSHVYSVNKEQIFKYFTFATDSAFYKGINDHVLEPGDSVVWERNFTFGGSPAKEFLVKPPKAPNYQRGLILPSGDHVYSLWAVISEGEEKSRAVADFLQSFRLKEGVKQSRLFRSERAVANELFTDLLSGDSASLSLATDALRYISLDSSHVEDLYKVYHSMNVPDLRLAAAIRQQLVDRLAELGQENTIPFFEQAYKALPDTARHKLDLLKGLVDMNSAAAITKAKDLLVSSPPKVANANYFSVFNAVKHAEATHIHLFFPELLSLLSNEFMATEVLDLTVAALDSTRIELALVEQHAAQFDQLGASLLEKYLNTSADDDDRYTYILPLQDYLSLISKFPLSAEREEMLRKLVAAEVNYLSIEGLRLLVSGNKAVEAGVFEKFAANVDYRVQLYDLLKEHNKLPLFPKKFHSQQFMAEGVFVNLLDYSDEYPDKITFIKKLKVTHEGDKGYVYVYKFSYNYEGESYEYLGYAGLYSTKKGRLEVIKNLSNYSYDDMPARGHIDKAIKAMLDSQKTY